MKTLRNMMILLPAFMNMQNSSISGTWRRAAALASCAVIYFCTTLAIAAPTPEIDQTLQPGDVIKIAFPAARNLDTTQQIRRDGKINLYMVGEIKAAGRTPAELQHELKQLYSKDLVSGEVNITIESAAFVVFVTGAVIRPGRIAPERVITALEAIVEAGGFDHTRANSKAVTVIRIEDGKTLNFTMDLKAVLRGRQTTPFYLKPYDIVYVPERFTLF